MPLTDDEKAQLLELAGKIDPKDDLSDLPIVPKQVFKGRLSDKDRARQSLEAEYQAKLSDLQTQHAEVQAKLQEHEDKNKTAEQLFADKIEQAETIAAEQRARAEKLYEQRRGDAMVRELMALFDKSDAKPARVKTAIREAMAEIKPKVEDNDGDFAITADTKEAFDGWWPTRTDLHEARGTGLPSPGAGHPPGDPPPSDPTEGMTDEQILAMGFREFG
jgi:hypothetical protein